MPKRPPTEGGLDLGFWLWLVGFAKAIADWLGDLGPTTIEPAEHLPDGHPDAAPSPPKPHGKYSPVDTRPGRWNRAEGRFNPPAGKN